MSVSLECGDLSPLWSHLTKQFMRDLFQQPDQSGDESPHSKEGSIGN